MNGNETQNDRVTLCPDGKYRWTYEMSLFKNPTVFLLITKIFFFIFVGIFAFITVLDLIGGDFEWGIFLSTAKIFGIVILGALVVITLGYLVYAAVMGGKYIVEFEMDERGVNHRQTESQAVKARKIGRAAAIGGLASGRFSVAGAGIAAQRTEMYSEFSKVKKVKAYPRRCLIKVNETLGHNQVYVRKEDFDFVFNYITDRCQNLKKSAERR